MSEYVFKLPDLGEGTVESEIAEWMVQVGDIVAEEQPICSMLTDKAAVELTAPVSGRVKSLAGAVGDTIAVGTPLVVFETAATSAPRQPHPAPQPPPVPPAAAALPSGKVKTSPSIRRRAREAGIDLERVPGTGPGGRVLPADFDTWLSTGGAPPAPPSAERHRAVAQTEIKVVGLRRRIAERMDRANREVPHFAYVEEVDVTQLESLRSHLNDQRSRDQPGLTPLAFIGRALVRAVRDFPQCNAHYDPERQVITRFEAVHLGIATQTPDGLKVPVVRHAEALSLQELAAEIRRVSAAARDNTATRDLLGGSTITLTSLGKLGGIVSTPIINLPEVAIIGVNKVAERAMIAAGQVAARKVMNLSSSFDHRFVDGYDAAAMIQRLKELLEQPALLFLD